MKVLLPVIFGIWLIACGSSDAGGKATSATLSPTGEVVTPSSQGGSPVPIPGNSQRIQAVNKTSANNPVCQAMDIFYWEIGDKNGALASGWGGKNAPRGQATEVDGLGPDIPIAIASASKWLFGAYSVQRDGFAQVSTGDIGIQGQLIARKGFLNFTSGYDQETKPLCSLHTVGDCFNGAIAQRNPQAVQRFSYNGGHMQAYAVALGLGDYRDNDGLLNGVYLADEIRRITNGLGSLTYDFPSPAGGANVSPTDYAQFLRALLKGELELGLYLGADPVCAWVDPAPGHKSCDALATPISGEGNGINFSAEHWHYSYGHWVEDDPLVGDGSFSSPGAFGFYPWINADKNLYGILARREPVWGRPALESIGCGRLLRKAWVTGIEQVGALP